MDPSAFVQDNLQGKERCLASVEAVLVQDWIKSSRILALIESCGEYGLFLYYHTVATVVVSSDIKIERAIPVDIDFVLTVVKDEESAELGLGSDVPISIQTIGFNSQFELPFGSRTNSFLGEVKRAMDWFEEKSKANIVPVFNWISQYQQQGMDEQSLAESNLLALAEQDTDNSINIQLANAGLIAETHQGSPEAKFMPLTQDWPWMQSTVHDNPNPGAEFLGFEDNFADMSVAESLDSSDTEKSSSVDGTPLPLTQRQSLHKQTLGYRENLIKAQMSKRESEFTFNKDFRMFVGTWNVNGKQATCNLSSWLASDPEPPDIYAIGYQELDLSKEAFLFNDSTREAEWLLATQNALHPNAKYDKLRLIRLVGMMLVVFIQKKHKDNITLCTAEAVGTGIMGKMGNKGGVSVRFELHNTSFCVVNSHLAAHVDDYERRNQDYHDICNRLTFHQLQPPLSVGEHDILIWLGDLNYRIDGLPVDDVKLLSDKKEYDALLMYDQLRQQLSLNQVFDGFDEGKIHFRPTYKYDPNTDDWDSSEKARAPAWCDRILWRSEQLKQVQYRSHMTLRISDHKPVSSIFDATVKVIDPAQYRKIREQVVKKLDRLENEYLPQVNLSTVELDFGTIYFCEEEARSLVITNSGQVPVQFEFIKKLDDSSYCKPWLQIKPYMGFIMPGDKSDVEFTVLVDKKTASYFNSGQDKIEDILILHLDGGKDYFLTISGRYIPSCFGASVEALVRMHGPIRDISMDQLFQLENPGKRSVLDTKLYDIPKEIWMLVDHLFRFGLKQDELFQKQGLQAEIQAIRNCLDTGYPEQIPGGSHSIAEALLHFLEALPEPIIPYSQYERCLECYNNFKECVKVYSQLPLYHRNVFKYLMAFLKHLLQYSDFNKLDPKMLATLFGGLLMRPPPSSPTVSVTVMQTNTRRQASFIYQFLVNELENIEDNLLY